MSVHRPYGTKHIKSIGITIFLIIAIIILCSFSNVSGDNNNDTKNNKLIGSDNNDDDDGSPRRIRKNSMVNVIPKQWHDIY